MIACQHQCGLPMRCGALDVQLPRVELVEMGPRLDLSVRRRRDAPPDLAKEAHRQPKLTGKKVQPPLCCSSSDWLPIAVPAQTCRNGVWLPFLLT